MPQGKDRKDVMKIIRFIPVVAVIALILGLTLQKTSDNVDFSEKCRLYVMDTADKVGIKTENAWWNTPSHFRKVGHVMEYFAFGFGIHFAVQRVGWSILICLLMSVSDQIIKIWVPVRHFDLTDLPFDAAGYLFGILTVFLILKAEMRREQDGSNGFKHGKGHRD